jgi:hypothetical protein
VWESIVNGRQLHFHLAGINNQNFIMRDEETGSWWQQVTGEAIQGPLKGQRLQPVYHDELTFRLWKREKPQGRVLMPDEKIVRANRYASADWEKKMTSAPVATAHALDPSLTPRTLIVGITINGVSRAYPFDDLLRQNPIVDEIAGVPLILVLAEDKKSVRAFDRRVDNRKLEFFLKSDSSIWRLVDAETASEWDFTGKAVAGPLSGKELKKIGVLNDYWFDWKAYNPKTTVYDLGSR